MQLDYAPGDPIYIFGKASTWGPQSLALGSVTRITPAGQIVVKLGDRECRFTKSGREIGAYADTSILPKDEASRLAEELRVLIRAERLKRQTSRTLEELSKRDASDRGMRQGMITDLRNLITKLEAV